MELYEELRREISHGVGTIKGAAKKFGVHRRTVREAMANAIPPPRKTAARKKPRIDLVKDFIDSILVADERVHRKQRHAARRIFSRLREERPEHAVAESTVRQYVRTWKAARGKDSQEVFIAQSYAWVRCQFSRLSTRTTSPMSI